mgnify:FL=1
MKKRIISLILCAVMVLPLLLTGCAKSSDDTASDISTTAPRTTLTLTMYMIADDRMNVERYPQGTKMMVKDEMGEESEQDVSGKYVSSQVQSVVDAINKILKSKYKTQLDIRFYHEKDYYEKLEAEIKAMKADQEAAENEGNNTPSNDNGESESQTEEETVLNKYGLPEYKYPTLADHQVDIFFIGGFDRYNEYASNEWLKALDEELKAGSKKLDDYISRQFLVAAGISGTTYAIPNNNIIGEYTYLLLDKELIKKYNYSATDITSLADAKDFLNDVKNYESGYDPLAYDSYKDPTLVHYWSLDSETLKNDPNQFSLIGCTYTSNYSYNVDKYTKSKTSMPLTFSSLFTRPAYRNQLLALKYYECNGFYAAENSDKPFAAAVVKGGAELKDKYADKYYVNVVDYPRATNEELYNSMFGLCGYSLASASRGMEVITYLNTNKDFRNLLQYGIENVNYTIDEKGALHRTDTNEYFMDIAKTGNVFMAYPEEGMNLDAWTYGKKQNLEAKIDCTLGFRFYEEASELSNIDLAAVKLIAEESAKIAAELAAIKDYDTYAQKIEEYATTYKTTNKKLNLQKYTTAKREAEGEPMMPVTIYYEWLESNKFISNEQ